MSIRRLTLAFLALLLSACASQTPSNSVEQQKIVDAAAESAANFARDPEMGWFRENLNGAKALLIVPTMVKGGFIFGGSGGSGVLVAKGSSQSGWSYPAFYTVGSGTFGLQIGLEVSELVLMVMTDAGIEALFSPDVKVGADVSVAAGPMGVGAKAQTADIIAFSRSKGLYGGINLEGAVVTPRRKWNEVYYGRKVTPSRILIAREVNNPGALRLRTALTQMDRL
jgi:lipid-binding SYLF domain-containing protein